MSGAGVNLVRGQADRGFGEDRFYNPAKARRNMQFQRALRSAGITVPEKVAPVVVVNKEVEKRAGSEECLKQFAAPRSNSPVSEAECVSVPPCSNLDRFLESTTPFVPVQYPSKSRMRSWRTCDIEYQPYFTLGDLWESFKEWSAYGAGVPLLLNGSDSVVQYYVPYLSGIQIYGDPSRPPLKERRPVEDSDGDYYRDAGSCSDSSSECEHERSSKYGREQCIRHQAGMQANLRFDRLLREKQGSFHDGSSSDDSDVGNSQMGSLLFEYLEQAPPYSREPLADKILDLARRFPDLKTLRSSDLLPMSWLSVAWYPIYRIPTGPTLKDLDACFLTYHPLSTNVRGGDFAPVANSVHTRQGLQMLPLPIFGLASYKFKTSIWIPNGTCERQQAGSLLQAADKWLRQLQVGQPDFRFFASQGVICR